MKAWHIFDGEPQDSSLLIFAPTRNIARWMAMHAGLWEYDEYVHIRARRRPEYDALFDAPAVIETNEELPAGAPPFYDDCDC